MHVSDIHEAIERGARTDLKAAFRALVLFPNEEEIAGLEPEHAVMQLCELLESTADALDGDSSIMPGHLIHLIMGETDGFLEGATYADGATALVNYVSRWRGFFDAAVARRGEG